MSTSNHGSQTIYNGVHLGPSLTSSDLLPLQNSDGSDYNYNLLLSSGSSTRRLILDSIPIRYEVMVKPVDERDIGTELRAEGSIESATKLVSLLAKVKREGVLEELRNQGIYSERIVLTADQVVTHPELGILEKPEDREEAEKFMKAYASTPRVTTVGSVMLTSYPSLKTSLQTFTSTVHFNSSLLTSDLLKPSNLLDRLLSSNAPVYECAGGLMIENEMVKEFIVRVDGSEDSVLGLSRRAVLECFRELRGM